MAQTKYNYAPSRGIAGGIFDSFHYPVDSRWNDEENGKLSFGIGVVRGSIEGTNIALPTEASVPIDFEGVIVNGFDRQMDLEGNLSILNNQNVGVMRKGKIWVKIDSNAAPAYGDELHLITSGENAGLFATEGGIKISGRFIGSADGNIAPVELYGIDDSAEAAKASPSADATN